MSYYIYLSTYLSIYLSIYILLPALFRYVFFAMNLSPDPKLNLYQANLETAKEAVLTNAHNITL